MADSDNTRPRGISARYQNDNADVSGVMSAAGVLARLNATPTVSTGATVMMDTVEYISGFTNGGDGSFTCTSPGTYEVYGSVGQNPDGITAAWGGWVEVRLMVNGVRFFRARQCSLSTSQITSFAVVIPLALGAIVKLEYHYSVAGSVGIGNIFSTYDTHLQIKAV